MTTPCIDCDRNIECTCIDDAGGLMMIFGDGSEGSPYRYHLDCDDAQSCVATMFANVPLLSPPDDPESRGERFVADGTGGAAWAVVIG